MKRTPVWRFGLGPVFAYEWITSSRRWQIYALRSLFVLVLLLALVSIWMNTNRTVYLSAVRYLADLGGGFFLALIGTQLTLVMLAAPAATASAICLDRARGTLTHMLMTDLSVSEIVLGKLAARLLPVLTMVACALPVLEILTLLGGVDPAALLAGLVVAVGVAVLGCSLAMALSLWVGKTHEALLCTYAIWLLWLLAGPMSGFLSSTIGWTWLVVPRRSEPFFMALAPYWWPGTVSAGDYLLFLGATCSIAAVLVGVTMLRLRSICRHDSVHRVRRSRSPASGSSAWRLLNTGIPYLTPSLEGNPVLWRESHRSRPSRWMILVTVLYGGLSLVFSVLAILWSGREGPAIVNAFQVASGLLLLSVTAATSLAEERARGSLDLLLSTPLGARQIFLGKWLGTFRMVPLLAILPAVVISAEDYLAETRKWWLCPMMIALVLCAGAAITSLGLFLATQFARVGRAVGSTVAVYVLVTVGWLPFAMLLFGPRSEKLVGASPFFWALFATMEAGNIRVPRAQSGAFFWIVFYALAAPALFLATLPSFEGRLGRIDDAASWLCRPSRLLRILTGLYFVWSLCFAFFLFIPSHDPTFVSFGTALLFALGLLLLSVRASWPLAGERSGGMAELRAAADRSPVRVLVGKWASAGRLVPGMMILPLMVVVNENDFYSEEWAPLLILLLFMVSVSLTAVSVGVAMFAWLGRSMWAVAIVVVIWGLSNSDWFHLGTDHVFDPASVWSPPVLPFSGVAKLCLWINGTRAGDSRLLFWAVVASALYAIAAGLLLVAALAAPRVRASRTTLSIRHSVAFHSGRALLVLLVLFLAGSAAALDQPQRTAERAEPPAAIWASGPLEVIVTFPKPIERDRANALVGQSIPYFDQVRAGRQLGSLRIVGVELADSGRTITIATDPHPGMGRYILPPLFRRTIPDLKPDPGLALAYDLCGVAWEWRPAAADAGDEPKAKGWWPSLDLETTRRQTKGSPPHEECVALLSQPGRLVLSAQLSLPEGKATVRLESSGAIEEAVLGDAQAEPAAERGPGGLYRVELTVESKGLPQFLSFAVKTEGGGRPFGLKPSYRMAGDKADRILLRQQVILPWAPLPAGPAASAPAIVPDLSGGDVARGQTLFSAERARCSQCHTFRGQGGKIGPDLTDIGRKGRADIYRNIAAPSAIIEPDYTTYTVATKDGQVLLGLVRAEGATAIRVTDTNAKSTVIARAQIAELRPSANSIMPVGLTGILGDAAIRDLIAYLTAPP